MFIFYGLLILGLIVLAFLGGKCISDSYNQCIIEELRYQLRLYQTKEGVGYLVPPVKPRRRTYMPIGQPFMDKLKENGRATQQISSSQQSGE